MASCPICRKADADPKYKPFCSRRCSDVDLQRWFTGAYAIPVALDESADDDDEKDGLGAGQAEKPPL
ncbi:DNA gyrase inhibitor YacG [uncultured Brevundimonas sp.]|uniref:DNA gyrase inhibitor YacG n=1 Tax=uncultured Brevundimonas sp. TaxID=213418 RepID=UPI0025E8B829|nr:DNA gyrase inhibitor YacG [uncultured Brevundimonas sp.]